MDLTDGVPMFMYERVRFDETGIMQHSQLVGAQVRNAEAQVIWPEGQGCRGGLAGAGLALSLIGMKAPLSGAFRFTAPMEAPR
jgi:hypothetical protein